MDPGPSRIKDMKISIPFRSVRLGTICHDIAEAVGLEQGWERCVLVFINGNPSHHPGGHDAGERWRPHHQRPMGGGQHV